MPKRYTAKLLVKSLEKLGFYKVSQAGSHLKMRGIKDGQLRTTIIPMHKDIATGTLTSILRQTNLTKSELDSALK